MSNIEIINVGTDDVNVVEVTPSATITHSLLTGKNDGIQHSIAAIDGLREELNNIRAPRTVSSDKTGVANYHRWSDNNPNKENRVGYFVTCHNDNSISVYNSEEHTDIFGVTVGSAAFVGGQVADIPRDYRYALVATSGIVKVRCVDEVKVGDNVVPNSNGIAVKSECSYGNRVAMRGTDDAGAYADIFLGVTPKQFGDMADNVADLESLVGETFRLIEELDKKNSGMLESIFTDVTIGNAEIDKVTIGNAEIDKVTIGNAEISDVTVGNQATIANANISEATIANAEINNVRASSGTIGACNFDQNGLKIEDKIPMRYFVRGMWTWQEVLTKILPNVENVRFTSNNEEFYGLQIADGYLKYFDKSGVNTRGVYFFDSNSWTVEYQIIDFGSENVQISYDFYAMLNAYAEPSDGAELVTAQATDISVSLCGSTNYFDNIFEIKSGDESKFYITNGGYAYGHLTDGTVGGWNLFDWGIMAYYGDHKQRRASLRSTSDINIGTVFEIQDENNAALFFVRPNGDVGIRTGEIGGWGIRSTGFYKETEINGETYEIIINNNLYTAEEGYPYNPVFAVHNQTQNQWPFLVRSNGLVSIKTGDIGGWNAHTTESGDGFYSTNYGDGTYRASLRSKADPNVGTVIEISHSGQDLWWVRPNGTMKAQKITVTDGMVVTKNDYQSVSDDAGWFTFKKLAPGGVGPDVEYCRFMISNNNKLLIYGSRGIELNAVNGGYLNGTWTSSSAITITSDKNKKHSIEKLDDRYSVFFDNLIARRFKYNDGTSNRYHSGFIAQEVEESLMLANIDQSEFAGVVTLDRGTDNEHIGLRYSEFVSLNTFEIQKLKARVKELEEKLATLNN